MKITYWSDYACPYCYIGEVRLDKAITKLQSQNELTDNVEIEMKAFQLDSNAPLTATGTTLSALLKNMALAMSKPANKYKKISQLAKQEGLDF